MTISYGLVAPMQATRHMWFCVFWPFTYKSLRLLILIFLTSGQPLVPVLLCVMKTKLQKQKICLRGVLLGWLVMVDKSYFTVIRSVCSESSYLLECLQFMVGSFYRWLLNIVAFTSYSKIKARQKISKHA